MNRIPAETIKQIPFSSFFVGRGSRTDRQVLGKARVVRHHQYIVFIPVPFLQTPLQQGGGRMLCNEYWMPLHRHLFPIIFQECRRHPGGDEIDCGSADGIDALVRDVMSVLVGQFEAGPDFGIFSGQLWMWQLGRSCLWAIP